MDLHQIEIFCTLVRLRSFSKAAEALYLTQPTVSGHIKNLENELGVRLLDRLGRRIIPTEEGNILYHYGRRILALRDEARQEIGGPSGRLSGQLKLGGSTIPGAYILPSFIRSFKKKYPEVSVRLLIEDTSKVAASVLAGDLCMGVIGARVKDPRLETHAFLKDELVVAVPKGHPWAKKKIITFEDLKHEPFILREEGSGTRRIMEEKLEKAGVSVHDLNVVAVMGSSDAVRQAVKAGLGVSIISIKAIKDDMDAGAIDAVRLKGAHIERNFYVVLLRGRSRSAACKAFLDFLLHRRDG